MRPAGARIEPAAESLTVRDIDDGDAAGACGAGIEGRVNVAAVRRQHREITERCRPRRAARFRGASALSRPRMPATRGCPAGSSRACVDRRVRMSDSGCVPTETEPVSRAVAKSNTLTRPSPRIDTKRRRPSAAASTSVGIEPGLTPPTRLPEAASSAVTSSPTSCGTKMKRPPNDARGACALALPLLLVVKTRTLSVAVSITAI